MTEIFATIDKKARDYGVVSQMVKMFHIKWWSSQTFSDKPDINHIIAIVMVRVHWR